MKLQDVPRKRHEFFEKSVTTSITFIELKLKAFSDLFSKEFKKLDTFCDGITEKVNVLNGATTQLVEDINSFNKGYTNEMKLMKEEDWKVFDNIEKSLIRFQELYRSLILHQQL